MAILVSSRVRTYCGIPINQSILVATLEKYSSYGGKKESTNKFMMIYWAKKADPIKDQSKANQM